MSILREILNWSKGLEDWQQDAIARLYVERELRAEDKEHVFALLRARFDIPDFENRVAITVDNADVVAAQVPNRLIQLVSIKNLERVNALAQKQSLPIGQTGLTVVDGQNGAGKSGYSRVLKQACRARQPGKRILADARSAMNTPPQPAKAAFDVLIDGVPAELAWTFGHPSPEELSELAIFDADCARAYLDNDGDFAYSPYGLDIIRGLVKLCDEFTAWLKKEKQENLPNKDQFAALAATPTKVGAAMKSLESQTPAGIEALATLSQVEIARLEILNRALTEGDPRVKAQLLRGQAKRFESLSAKIGEKLSTFSDESVEVLRTLIENSNSAKVAAKLAAMAFEQRPSQLDGTGSEQWKALFSAARDFAIHSGHPSDFAKASPDDLCLLCQKALGDEGVERLAAFDAFVEATTEKAAKAALSAAADAYGAIKEASPDVLLDTDFADELADASAEVSAHCAAAQSEFKARQAAIIAAASKKGRWEDIPKFGLDSRSSLAALVAARREEAIALEKAVNEHERAKLGAEHAELDARRRLAEVKTAALETLRRYDLIKRLDQCLGASTKTQPLSAKSTSISNEIALEPVEQLLNAEMKALNVHTLRAKMKPESARGDTKYKLVLELPGGGKPTDILSEGEQRAIAIASFLTEMQLGASRSGIVFDDPVSSLDHVRRERVAKRLAREALTRQVIVFTHDLYFFNTLRAEAKEQKADLSFHSLRIAHEGYGVPDPQLPFAGQKTKERMGKLRELHAACKRSEGDEVTYRSDALVLYAHLRPTWEKAVEELMLNNVIQRFDPRVQTGRLSEVEVLPEDVDVIERNMTICSKYTGHDNAELAMVELPSAEEIGEQLDQFDQWRTSLSAVNRTVRF
jgi:energy-coupling factor transporter ATP-binding protein EcfA2